MDNSVIFQLLEFYALFADLFSLLW